MKSHLKFLIGLSAVAILLAALPGIVAAYQVRQWSRGEILALLAHHTYGSTYYNARLREIKDGFPFIGNPYFKEHNRDPAPAFFVADWLAALPLFAGLPLAATILLNVAIWSAVFICFSYLILSQLGVSKWGSALGALLTFAQGYFIIITPVSMQTVFPFWLLLLLSFIVWFKQPTARARQVFFVLSAAGTFYVYTYLAQVALAWLVLAGLIFLFTRRQRTLLLRRLLLMAAGVIVLSLPMIIYTVRQLQHPYYWETMERIGLVQTRLPMAEAVYTSFGVAALVGLWWLTYRFFNHWRDNSLARTAFYTFLGSGLALIGVTFSNIITGKDLELPGHISRFMTVWQPLALVAYLALAIKDRDGWRVLNRARRYLLLALFVFSILGLGYLARHYWSFFRSRNDTAALYERFRHSLPALQWLEQAAPKPQVVLTGPADPLSSYIPALTKHYVLFANGGILHLLSSREAEDRYLVASLFKELTPEYLERDFQTYAGVGNAVHQYRTHNRAVKICWLLQLPRLGRPCGELATAVSWRGEQYFIDLFKRYVAEVKVRPAESLRRYNVTYVVHNKELDPAGGERYNQTGLRPEYADDFYAIYSVNYLPQ
ncbi:MAG: hypothetical protein HYV42_01110 [Candidatus Magasanikbacteria bacterium]|nr:hypothetical protein [Candidatus Magasanikbacteria bacterium]